MIFKISEFFGQIYLSGADCGKWNLKNQNLCKILGISIKDPFCSGLFLYSFETYQKLPYKISLPGYKLYPFSCTSQYLRIIYWAFSDPKDQGYLKLTQNFENFDIAKHQKCQLLNQKKPLCHGWNFITPPSFLIIHYCIYPKTFHVFKFWFHYM